MVNIALRYYVPNYTEVTAHNTSLQCSNLSNSAPSPYNRVLRGKVFGTLTPKFPVIFCPDPDRTEKIVNLIVPTPDRPDYISPGPDQTETI